MGGGGGGSGGEATPKGPVARRPGRGSSLGSGRGGNKATVPRTSLAGLEKDKEDEFDAESAVKVNDVVKDQGEFKRVLTSLAPSVLETVSPTPVPCATILVSVP